MPSRDTVFTNGGRPLWALPDCNMESDSQDFFDELASCSRTGFKTKFSRDVRRLRLNESLNRSELASLQKAAFLAALCNISFNGLGGCEGEIRPENEPTRLRLEHSFMSAVHNFYQCPGWMNLKASQKQAIRAAFLTIEVNEANLAH